MSLHVKLTYDFCFSIEISITLNYEQQKERVLCWQMSSELAQPYLVSLNALAYILDLLGQSPVKNITFVDLHFYFIVLTPIS